MVIIQRYRGVDIKLDKGRFSILDQNGQVITRDFVDNIRKYIDAQEAYIDAEITRMKEERNDGNASHYGQD